MKRGQIANSQSVDKGDSQIDLSRQTLYYTGNPFTQDTVSN
ncbi:hypothetical protein SAMN04487946_1148 [Halobellus clavatus]|jgi:hypothetical protein|uniref:Uncharacterized protein n=1 Tax=Halobellus clavatus TaxID=660517 RepID=A0A1H3JJA8_9EURY|nr:hypothetical protein SAMN04487946_1148 [Halobellus clavatus]